MIYNSSKKSTSEIPLRKVQKYCKASLNLICSLEIIHKYTLCMEGIILKVIERFLAILKCGLILKVKPPFSSK